MNGLSHGKHKFLKNLRYGRLVWYAAPPYALGQYRPWPWGATALGGAKFVVIVFVASTHRWTILTSHLPSNTIIPLSKAFLSPDGLLELMQPKHSDNDVAASQHICCTWRTATRLKTTGCYTDRKCVCLNLSDGRHLEPNPTTISSYQWSTLKRQQWHWNSHQSVWFIDTFLDFNTVWCGIQPNGRWSQNIISLPGIQSSRKSIAEVCQVISWLSIWKWPYWKSKPKWKVRSPNIFCNFGISWEEEEQLTKTFTRSLRSSQDLMTCPLQI